MSASSSTASLPCANTGSETQPSPCSKTASRVCSNCRLVQYCSTECQHNHWRLHKPDCRSPLMKSTWKPAWDIERRAPSFTSDNDEILMSFHGQRKYLWGNVPAIDILNLRQNEGVDFHGNLRLLFAASGDLRNVIQTVNNISTKYSRSCDIVVNDMDPEIVARNTILLLIALHLPPEEATPLMLHVWYSVLLPARLFRLLKDEILPLVEDVCSKIDKKPEESLQAKTWTYGSSSLRLVLCKCQWDSILQCLRIPVGLTADRAQEARRAVMLAPERLDYVDRGLYKLPLAWRVGTMKFRKDGLLLPFGMPRDEFDTPNPTFFCSRDFWPMMDSADPLQGWPMEDILRSVPSAVNDVYGGMYFLMKNTLTTFGQRLKDLKISFTLFQLNAVELPNIFEAAGLAHNKFDRIEVSNIVDGCHLGLRPTLSYLSPLLHPRTTHPHATLITLFLNAIHEIQSPMYEIKSHSALIQAQHYLPSLTPTDLANLSADKPSAAITQLMEARMLFWDFDALFGEYMSKMQFPLLAAMTSVMMKEKNTVIEEWPLKLRKGADKSEFDILLGSGHTGCERYVEWKRV